MNDAIERLQEIAAKPDTGGGYITQTDARAILAHIDSLTACLWPLAMERAASWHDAEAARNDELADSPIVRPDGEPALIGADMAIARRRKATWHREAAAAIRAQEPPK